MKFYLLSDEFLATDRQFFAAANAAGTSISERLEQNALEPSRIYLEVRHQNWKMADKPPSSTSELIMRDRVANVIVNSCAVDPAIRRFPAVFYFRSTENIVERGFQCWVPTKMHDSLDRNKAVANYYKGQILQVKRWVLSAKKIPSFDLFLSLPNQWIVTSRVRNVCVEFAFSGFKFEEVEVAP